MAKQEQKITPNWGRVLTDKGVVISITCRWYKGQRRIEPEDLDLAKEANSAEFQKLLSLGQKIVIPKDVFDNFHRIETRARSLLVKYSYETPFGLFVPYKAMPFFEEKINEIEADFNTAKQDMLTNYSKYRGKVLEDYNALGKTLFTNGNNRLLRARLLNAVRRAMPMKHELNSYYEFLWQPFHIATPSELVKDQKKAEMLAEGKAIKYAVNKKLAETYEKKTAQAIDSFVAQSVKQMRGVVNDLVIAALKSIDKNDGVLVPRLSTTLKQMVDHFHVMNVFGNEDIEKQLDHLKSYLASTDGDGPKRTPQVKEMLKDLRSSLKERISDNLFIRQTRKGIEL